MCVCGTPSGHSITTGAVAEVIGASRTSCRAHDGKKTKPTEMDATNAVIGRDIPAIDASDVPTVS